VPDRLRGRIFAFYDVVWQGSRLASIAAGGVLADAFGIRAVYLLGGLLLFAAGALGHNAEVTAAARFPERAASGWFRVAW
jgi:MFS family permease